MKKTEKQQQRVKVLFLINNLVGGGAEKVLMHILHRLDRSCFDIHLLLVCREGVYVPDLPEDITLHHVFSDKNRIPAGPLRFLYRAARSLSLEVCMRVPGLWKKVSGIREHYDIGISFLEGYATSLLTLKREHFGRIIAWFHNDVSAYKPTISKKQLDRYREFDRLYFVSDSARQGFLKRYPEFASIRSRMEVLYNPVDVSAIRNAAQSNVLPESEEVTLLAIGRLTPQKRFDKLLNVHRRLLEKGIRHRVCILGEGELRVDLENQIRSLGIENSCSLPGFQNPYPYLAAADLFVMTSDYEGLPVVICEAMALAVPCLVTDVSGSRELLEEGKYGIIVDNNEQAIEEGLERMILDPARRKEFVDRLKENHDHFIFSRAMDALEEKLLTRL